MEARQRFLVDEPDDEFDRVIARIRARGPGLMEPPPSPAAIAAVLAQTRDEQPLSGEELAAHERMWQQVDAEIEALDQSVRGTESTGDDPV